MKNRLYHVILLALMAIMINACATPKKEGLVTEAVTLSVPVPAPEDNPIVDKKEEMKDRWSAGEMDR